MYIELYLCDEKVFMKVLRIILYIVIGGFLCFLAASYAITTPDDRRLTFEEANQKAQEYVNRPKCVVGEGCHQTGNTLDVGKAFPVYAISDDVPDFYYFPIVFPGERSWPNTVGVYLFSQKSYTTGNYWDILDELKGSDGKNKLYNLGGIWYGVPEKSTSNTIVETYGHDFTKHFGPQRGSMSFSEFTGVLQEYRESIAKSNLKTKNHPLYRMRSLKERILKSIE